MIADKVATERGVEKNQRSKDLSRFQGFWV